MICAARGEERSRVRDGDARRLVGVHALFWQISHDRPVLLQSNVGHTGAITGMSFTTDDRQLVSIGADGCIFVWNIFHADGDEGKAPHK
eukprot:CAMPEP_0202036052 /NCGR_PEP_ID=MMETSP0962-20130828/1309_1 /ASSEMBLY_ACC=CAM_ASM_000488 /TAXON_ID=4773 /ORGANISM="Schizochytrium aggregatum, Strain ATCC28209" /LENGTH=88 /DNA_ID=CAMNT_0048600111 /DNA_START=1 /DNA_END=267 /DNA_ORIENTATION=-